MQPSLCLGTGPSELQIWPLISKLTQTHLWSRLVTLWRGPPLWPLRAQARVQLIMLPATCP